MSQVQILSSRPVFTRVPAIRPEPLFSSVPRWCRAGYTAPPKSASQSKPDSSHLFLPLCFSVRKCGSAEAAGTTQAVIIVPAIRTFWVRYGSRAAWVRIEPNRAASPWMVIRRANAVPIQARGMFGPLWAVATEKCPRPTICLRRCGRQLGWIGHHVEHQDEADGT